MTPERSQLVEKSSPELLDVLMTRLHGFLSFLELDESTRFLTTLRDTLGAEIDWGSNLLARQSRLLGRIGTESDYATFRVCHDELNSLEMERFLKIPSVPALHKSCTEYRDLLAGRALCLAEEEMRATGKGGAPCPFALVSMGSDGREEQTLITDQDYLIVYDDGGGEEADAYFKEFAYLLVERLAEIGFKKCTGDIMPSNPTWRGSLAQWKRRLLAIVRYEFEDYAKNLMDLIVLSDARYVAGDKELATTLIRHIRDLQQDYFQVLWGMAKAATEMKLAVGFLKRIWTEGAGEHKGEFNLKLLAWAPLVMNVRILAINQGIPVTSTLQRIEFLERDGSISRQTASGLAQAYHILTRHRVFLQIKVIKGIQADSYYLNPYQLSPGEREQIRLALLKIEELQKIIHTNFSIM